MRNFAFGKARTIAEAAASAGLVAEAMLAADGGAQSQDVRVVKAGGIDLIDLMKEGLLAPAEVTSLQGVPGLDAIAPTPDGGLSVGPMVTLARLAADPSIRERYPALAEAAGESASPQIRAVATHRRQSPAAPALLVFPRGRIPLPAQGRRPLLRDFRREPVSRDLRQPVLRDRPSLDLGHRARRARGGDRTDRRGRRNAPRRARGLLRRAGQRRPARERPQGQRTPDGRAAAAGGGPADEASEARAEGIVRLAAGRRRGRSRSGRERRLQARLDRARRGGADAVAGARGGGGAERKDNRCGSRRRGGTGRARRRDARSPATPTRRRCSRRW